MDLLGYYPYYSKSNNLKTAFSNFCYLDALKYSKKTSEKRITGKI